jgi:hypothetical protein
MVFSRKTQEKERNVNTMENTAKKLTLEEIKALPRASVIWLVTYNCSDDGVVWHEVDPSLICVAGEGGVICGADNDSTWDFVINDDLFERPYKFEFWNYEPNREQLPGITGDEYNGLPNANDDLIMLPELAAKITYKGFTFDRFCEQTGLNSKRFWKALIGKREFMQWEIVVIRSELNLSDDDVREIFFPEFEEKPAALAQI